MPWYLLPRRTFAVFLVLALCGVSTTVPAHAGPVFLPGFPLLRQQHSLTCESSAASMATRGRISEAVLMASMPRNSNPNLGFRGNPDGQQGTALRDYGVYAGPLHRALLRFGYSSNVITYGSDALLRTYLNQGWPLVTWVTYGLQPATPRLSGALGVQFVLVPHEHALLVVGYDSISVTANDPWTGHQVRYAWKAFNRSWGLFGNMALAVRPCLAPQPIPELRAKPTKTGGIRWAWKRTANVLRYHVTLTRSGAHGRILFQSDQSVNSYVQPAPVPAVGYLLTVTAKGGCGMSSAPARAWYWSPPLTSTPSPTVTPTPATETPIGTTPPTRTVAPVPTSPSTATAVTILPTATATPTARATP